MYLVRVVLVVGVVLVVTEVEVVTVVDVVAELVRDVVKIFQKKYQK